VHICGNIGNPFSVEIEKMKAEDYVSLEVSSFQLERIATFKPKISVILNFTPDHLDRYNNIKEYLEAKKRIFMNQDEEDYLVLNYADYTLRDLAKEAKAKVIYFGTSEGLNPNYQAVMAVAVILGISQDTVNSVLNNFRGLEHRMEYVAELNGIEFINDSKATNIESTFWALKNINKPIILIAGGRDKGLKFETIRDIVRDKVKLLILIGEAKMKLRQALKDVVDIKESDFLEEAVRLAFHNTKKGDCVLLSPMCASFDMFANFEERGNIFKKAVRELI
jgi:UDP-N-acetylmuramoylalanine--D-glutamate ligase